MFSYYVDVDVVETFGEAGKWARKPDPSLPA
jgi:hypothetical protein